jgi:hypothetical protein
MKLTAEQKKSQELLQKIITKAWGDKAFMAELTANPLEVIKRTTGETVVMSAGKVLIVRDQTDDSKIFINIPTDPSLVDAELNQEQLESVTGGGSSWSNFVIPVIPVNPSKDGFNQSK